MGWLTLLGAGAVTVSGGGGGGSTLDLEFVAGTYSKGGTSYGSLAVVPGISLTTPATVALNSDNTPVAATANAGRIGTAGLLVEETRTNYSQYSDGNYTASYYDNVNQTQTNGQTDPMGGTNAGLYTATSSGSYMSTKTGNPIGAGAPTSYSVYLKAGTLGLPVEVNQANVAGSIDFQTQVNLATGALSNSTTAGAATLISANSTTVGSGGWYRIDVNGSFTAAQSMEPGIQPVGSGTGTFYDAFWQQENGGFATSYIRNPSTSSTTRPADNVSVSSLTTPAVAFEMDVGFTTTRAVNQARTLVDWNDGTDSNKIIVTMDSTNHLVLTVINGGTSTVIATEGGTPAAARSATANVLWDGSGNWTLKVSGTTVATTAAAKPTVTAMQIGQNRAVTQSMNDFITSVKVQ